MIFYVIVYVVIKSPLLRLLSLSVRYGLGLLISRYLIVGLCNMVTVFI